jgi:hypothetical protein
MSDTQPIDAYARRPQIEAELQQRIVAHQRLLLNQGFLANRDAARPLNLLAAGDSWFDYPLTDDELPIPSDVIVQLRSLVAPRPFILPLAHRGDASTELLGVTKRQRLLAALQEPKNGKFDAICFLGAATISWENSFAYG